MTLSPKLGRLSTKLKVMTLSLQSTALYVAQFASFNASQLAALDRYFIMLLRGYVHTGGQVAYAIILEPKLGGYLQPMWGLVTKRKQALLQRATFEGGHTRLAIESLMMRHARRSNGTALNDPTRLSDPFVLTSCSDCSWWAAHLILDGNQRSPPVQWRYDPGTRVLNNPPLPALSLPATKFLLDHDVLSLDELVNWDHAPPVPLPWLTQKAPADLLRQVVSRAKAPPPPALLPSRGQLLLLDNPDDHDPTAIQLMGWVVGGGWQVRQLKLGANKPKLLGRYLEDDDSVVSLLAGSSMRLSHSELVARVSGRLFSLDTSQESTLHNFRTTIVGVNPSFRFSAAVRPISARAKSAVDAEHRDCRGMVLPSDVLSCELRSDQVDLPPPPWVQLILNEMTRLQTDITLMVSDASARRKSGPISSIFAL